LGDYIYEGGIAAEARPRKHNSKKIFTVDEYRNRYALYKSDESLKRAHAAAPWMVTPDDHEVENNFADEISEVRYVTRKEFREHRAAAYQAYYEHMPLRRSSLAKGPDIQLYRNVPFGRLAQFFVLDTRQYRTDQTCGDGTKPPCDEEMDPNGSILGDAQRKWLFDGLRRPTAWNILAQQVMMARVDMRAGPEIAVSHDQWPSYEFERRRVLQYLRDQEIRNSVVLTGDIHSNWANDLIANFDDLDSETVASEFVGTSISSGGDGNKAEARMKSLMTENPFVKYFNAERGYVSCHVTPKQWRSDYRMVDYVAKPGSPIGTRASFIVENGHPGVQKA
jgi:alkaline phosphatase D